MQQMQKPATMKDISDSLIAFQLALTDLQADWKDKLHAGLRTSSHLSVQLGFCRISSPRALCLISFRKEQPRQAGRQLQSPAVWSECQARFRSWRLGTSSSVCALWNQRGPPTRPTSCRYISCLTLLVNFSVQHCCPFHALTLLKHVSVLSLLTDKVNMVDRNQCLLP